MFGKKCSLCGGKLDGNGICTECGLDNTKDDSAYRTGRNDCENQPLTHVHTERTMEEGDRKRKTVRKKAEKGGKTVQSAQAVQPNPAAAGWQTGQDFSAKVQQKKKKIGCSMFAFMLLILVFSLVKPLLENIDLSEGFENTWDAIFEEDYSDEYDSEWEETDPYEDVTREIPAEGSEESYALTSGCYIVGVHIPEGIYQAQMEDDFDVIQVDDPDQGIYLYEYRYLEEEGNCYLDDLRLYEGAVLYVETNTQTVLSTSNAQPMEEAAANPLTQEYNVKGTTTAGQDFEPGVYDLELVNGEGYVALHIDLDENGDIYTDKSFSLGAGFEEGAGYRNLVIPEGAELKCDPGVELRLIPSEVIFSTDYQSFYTDY